MMERKYLEISDISIKNIEGYSELSVMVQVYSGKIESAKKLWYRTDKEYGKYYVTETYDAFVTVIIYFAMWYGYDINVKGKISEELLYRLNNYYIPLIAKTKPFFNIIRVIGEAAIPQYKCANEGSTGISCGVDSFYTLLRHLEFSSNDLHIIKNALFQDWFSSDFNEKEKAEWRDAFRSRASTVCTNLGIKFIYVSCNIDEVFPTPEMQDKHYGYVCGKGFYTYKYCSAALALGKLIGKYYFSSGYDIGTFDLNPKSNVFDEDHYSLFNISVLQTEKIKFYHYGGDMTRIEKLHYISQHSVARKYLSVCANKDNCGICPKCVRTMGELYSINKLEEFKDCFPIELFYRNKAKNFGFIRANKNNPFFLEIITTCGKEQQSIPYSSYFYMIVEKLKIKLRKYEKLRNLYRKFRFR